ncbi:unnamed protein product (macronuclear) [Paramecium tetraurelia]|uniref:Transmembrane protein n=1 Tax=Paramecium tetraurelia TaxID=5888 RepID=A0DR72_PARTE|nr:uncharacterized protein GSPATT00019256001 [Paramecium tetraurelia]CAK85539.1 unnamed protein product [Paramecium tetraurelia]|eukprot:XP_001452936.1 hypothetical protein (macronuclear) [Paramecium tetraurelia strain d4-2]
MLNNISEFLRRIDQFGASYKPSYSYGEVQFKTSLGGLLSIVLYGLSLAYLIYELILWKSGRILPKITSLQTEIETYSLQFDKVTIASFCLRKHTSIHNQIDPFDPNNVIVLPMLYEILNDEFQEPQTLLSTKKSEKHGTYLIEVKNIELSNNEHESLDHPNKEFLLVFQECTQDLLPEGWYCAKEDRIKTFFNQKQNQLQIQTFVNQYNTSTKKIDIVEQDYYASFDNKTTYFSQIVIGSTNISIDTGFLLESLEIIEFPSSLQSYIQQMDLDYFAHSFQNKIFLAFEFELGTLQQTVYVEYPKVSEVLANIGSIVSFFLFFSHIAYMINEKNLELKVLRTLIEMYYPQMKEVTFKKNCYGKVIQVLYKNSRVSISFLETYNKFLKIAQAKLCLTNQLYEVSRLQFILNSICDKQVFRDCHDIGIRLKGLDFEHDPDKHNNKPNIIKVENIIQQELKLENVENESIKELNITKINPKATIEMQSNQIQVEQLNQSQSLFLGKMIENQLIDEEDFKLSDEDFYVLMQHQSRIKELEYETVALQNQQQIQYEVQN